ncbi:putative nuclease HARBI1 [Portunus trituberculatus]|uniref:Putative nuclease HARBI1 n=1 Tax=Portunus trituberculatus TaxID=210409 RepID=A0A5B7G978_PORTR|nr:putative nuclease HARBI1 [Portunus trituberculatus]
MEVLVEHIRFLTSAEEVAIMQAHSTIAGMPGCIDGTLIPIRGLGGDDAELYCGCKGLFAYKVMVLCDASLLVTNLVVNWPGSAHNSKIFNESRLCHTLETGQWLSSWR